jgi:ferredoxin--NADP+ reductase
MSKLKAYTIADNKQIAPNAFLLSIKRDFNFIAGQVIGITTHNSIAPRLYSICSGINDPLIKILYTIKPGGELTPKLSELKCGNTIYINMPSGKFLSTNEPAYWIASGTGIAPFVSMLMSGDHKNKKLIHGSRTFDHFYFADMFVNYFGNNYIRCCSGEFNENTYHGRLTNYLSEANYLPQMQMYYICGSAEMVVETRDILIGKGIPYNNIASEIYF